MRMLVGFFLLLSLSLLLSWQAGLLAVVKITVQGSTAPLWGIK